MKRQKGGEDCRNHADLNGINTGFSVEKFLIFYVYNIIPYIDKMHFFLIYIVVKKRKSQKVEN